MKTIQLTNLRLSLLLLVLIVFPAAAQEPDAEGCSDSPILSRMSGCYIHSCEESDYDEMDVQTGPYDEETGEWKMETKEGRTTKIAYYCPGRLSPLQIVRNAENALKKSGFTLVHSGDSMHSEKGTTLRKGGLWAQIAATEVAGDETEYYLWLLEQTGMDQEMTSDVSAWADELESNGRVAIYGIEFDTGKSTIRPEAEPVLRDIVTLLESQPSLRLRVEGHTDNVGAAETNQKLSEARAKAVEDWLVGKGITRSRLSSSGEGASHPIADNRTDEGRARNRRVELVRL